VLDQVTVIAFDLDDTLWPCGPTLERAEKLLYQWLKRHYPRITRSFDPAQMVEQRHHFSQREPHYRVDFTALRRDFLQHLGDSHDYDGESVARHGFDVFFQARQQVEFFDDALPSLESLRQRYRLGVVSNGNASVEHVGLGHLIEHAVSASDLRVAKPDRRIFEALAARFETPPRQIVYVGDHPRYDVMGPREAGLQSVWLNRERQPWPEDLPEPDHEVADLHEFSALFSG